ncbi:MAG TPA: hypothetical protein VEV81_01790 [Pyrinomonadaceae bacterium]|nr:hypothetical protein [Pyrinomonadaceae bacterium]
MRSALLPLLFIMALAVTARPAGVVDGPALNQNFDLRVGQTVSIEGTRLKVGFQSVVEDSRCPEDVTCVWAGNAKISLSVNKVGRPRGATVINLNSGLNPKHISYQGYDIKLVGVKPPRNSKTKIGQGDYVITLIVTKI